MESVDRHLQAVQSVCHLLEPVGNLQVNPGRGFQAQQDQLWELSSFSEAAMAAALSAYSLPDPPPSRPR